MTSLVAALLFAWLQQAPSRDTPAKPTAGTAVIAGVVVTDEAAPHPLRRVLVTIAGAELRVSQQVVSDDAGRFAFPSLPAGRYTLTAEKPAYVKTFFGAKRPGRPPGTPIAVADGQRVTDVTVKLLRGAVISGVVLDQNGGPVSSAQVMSFEPVFVDGRRKLVDVNGALQWATTDDRGRYRLYGFPPGQYTVRAAGGPSGVEISPAEVDAALQDARNPAPTGGPASAGPAAAPVVVSTFARYYPSSDAATAELVTLAAGEERGGVNIVITRGRTSRVDGVSVGPGGEPMVNVMISMINATEHTLWASPGFLRPGADGRFTQANFPPGQYTLVARGARGPAASGAPGSLPLWAEATFDVNGSDVSGVVLQFSAGSPVSGSAVFQGTQAPPDPANVHLSLTAVSEAARFMFGVPSSATLGANGAFTLEDVPPGKYRLTVTGAGTWSMRSASLNGRDTLDSPFDVTTGQALSGLAVVFTDQPSELSGVVLDRLGRPTPEYSIVVFSTNRAHWTDAPRRMSGAVKLGSDGRYKVTGLPAGEYFISAVADIDARQLADPSVLESLVPASITITLGGGEKKTQDLRLGGG